MANAPQWQPADEPSEVNLSVATNWTLETFGNVEDVPTMDVVVSIRNYLFPGGAVETNIGNMILAGLPQAMNLALGRVNMSYYGQGGGAHAPVVGRLGGSGISLTITGLPTVSDTDNPVLAGDRHPLRAGETLLKLATRLYQEIRYRFIHQTKVGSLNIQQVVAQPTDGIRIRFSFTLVKPANWAPAVADNMDNGMGQGGAADYFEEPYQAPMPPPQPAVRRAVGARELAALTRDLRSGEAAAPSRASARVMGLAPNVNRERFSVRGRRYPPTYIGAEGRDDGRYAQLKERIYIKRSLEDFFVYSKAYIGVPDVAEKLCFPMAFMRCQMRRWGRKVAEDGTITCDMEEVCEDETVDIDLDPEIEPPNAYPASFFRGNTLRVFDNTKVLNRRQGSHGRRTYRNEINELPEEELELWKWCAYQLHYYVEAVCEQEIDRNDLELCLMAYSFAFEVNIAVYAMEVKGRRIIQETWAGTESRRSDKFIGLLLQHNHLHAISHIREYHQSQLNPVSSSTHTYCDYCATMCYSRTRDFKHVNKCALEGVSREVETMDSLHAKEAKVRETTRKFQYLKKEKAYQDVCTACLKPENGCVGCSGGEMKRMKMVQCTVCYAHVPLYHFNSHYCFMSAKRAKDPLDPASIFVYDIESMQNHHPESGRYVHECILVCLRSVYDERRWSFPNIADFVRFLIDTKEMHGSTILAHNGGGYDHQFVVRYLEDNGIMHSIIPRPNTLHKYLLVEIGMTGAKTAIRFLDFMMLMTDSLRNIGKAFKLDVCKGDFPHKFSTREHLEYDGPIPPMDTDDDWFSFKDMKNQNELAECRRFWSEQHAKYCSTCPSKELCNCGRPSWNFKKELEEYCWKDVDVLAGACKAYRDQALNFEGASEYGWETNGVDPFQYMTQSQIALALFLQGRENNTIAVTHEKLRPSFDARQLVWMDRLMRECPQYKIQHAGNSFREYYDTKTHTYLDGYCPVTKTAFEYLDCIQDGCPVCFADKKEAGEIHPTRGVRWKDVISETQRRLRALTLDSGSYRHVRVRWSHEDVQSEEGAIRDHPETNLMRLRDFFYGGRTEVFAAYANPEKFPQTELLHHDVCSLYPYVCSWKELPVGLPDILYGNRIDKARLNPNHPQKYFGFARIRVRPNTRDFIAILPQRSQENGNGPEKLTYDLFEKEGCWHTELIYLAMEHQYEILEVYEVWSWGPSQRSTTLMRGYMEFFLRMKQEAEGWEKLGKDLVQKEEKDMTDDEKEAIAVMIHRNNGGFAKPRKERVEKNPVLRQLAKIFLNCLWGKLCQKNASEYEQTIYGYKQYLEILSNSRIAQESLRFRHVNGCVFKVRYKVHDTLVENNRFLNVPIAASVTAHAQVVLMRQMFKIGPERVLYCDTDSIMFLRGKSQEKLNMSGLGNWEDEHPGERLTRFWALAPKCYMMEVVSACGASVEHPFKCKGVRATEVNRRRINAQSVHRLVEEIVFRIEGRPILADTMTMHPNSTNAELPYGTLCTSYGQKQIRVVFSKRELIFHDEQKERLDEFGIVRLTPFGYTGRLGHA